MFKATAYNNLQISNKLKIKILASLLALLIFGSVLKRHFNKTDCLELKVTQGHKHPNSVKYEQFRNYFCQVHELNDSQCKDQAPSPSEFDELLEYGRNRIHELEEITKEIINWQMMESD